MSKVVPVSGMLLVEKFDKGKRRSEGSSPFLSVIASANLGVVKYSSDENYPVGTQVYFGGQREQLMVEGVEVMAMKTDNIIAKLME